MSKNYQTESEISEPNEEFESSLCSFDINEGNELLEIDVGTRTGKPSASNIGSVNSEKRFRTRVRAFEFLNKYWLPVRRSRGFHEVAKRSISPLKIIFEYQEEEIFDIPPERKSMNVKIAVGGFDDCSPKKIRVKRRGRKAARKGSANCDKSRIIEGLSSILSEMESQDETKVSDYCDTTTSFKSKSSKTISRRTKSKRSKVSGSQKSIGSGASFLKPSVRRTKKKKSRPSSISYGKV